jgi:hypothetical protein
VTPILDANDYAMVRAAIGVEVDARALPDDIIALPIYQGAAEIWAHGLDEDWAARTGDERTALKCGVALKTASLLVTAMPFLIEETFGRTQGFRRQEVDIDKLAAFLNSRASGFLLGYLDPGYDVATEVAYAMPATFTVGHGYRTEWWPGQLWPFIQ